MLRRDLFFCMEIQILSYQKLNFVESEFQDMQALPELSNPNMDLRPAERDAASHPENKEPPVNENSMAAVKDSLAKFIDALHSKAAMVTTWIASLESPNLPNPSPRAKQLLV